MKSITLIISILFLSVSVVGQSATGSWTLGPNWTYNRNINNLELARIAMQGEISKRLLRGSNGDAKSKTKVLATGPTSYSSKNGYLLPGLISEQAEATPYEKGQLKNALTNSLQFYENIALLKEYPAKDLSFAMLYFVINNYVIFRNIDPAATDVSGEPQYLVGGFYSPLFADERAVYSQLRSQLARNRDLKAMKNEEKQKAAEMLAIYTTLMWHQFQDYSQRRDMKGLGNIRNRAAANVEGFVGADISKIEINGKGIVIHK